MNESGIKPCGHRLLVQPFEVEEKTASGIIVQTGSQRDREQLAQTEAIIVEVGPTAWSDQTAKWAQAGDHVIFSKFSGIISKGADGKEYRLINDLDVVAIKAQE